MMQNEDTYEYQYFLKDHLGNTRITMNQNGTILLEDAYYPFGMNIAGLSYSDASPENRYKYNGKRCAERSRSDLEGEFGLDWYDYGARFYDAVLGRFPCVDPIIEQFPYLTPFNYASNNPITNIDLWGLQGANSNAVRANWMRNNPMGAIQEGFRQMFDAAASLFTVKAGANIKSTTPLVEAKAGKFSGSVSKVKESKAEIIMDASNVFDYNGQKTKSVSDINPFSVETSTTTKIESGINVTVNIEGVPVNFSNTQENTSSGESTNTTEISVGVSNDSGDANIYVNTSTTTNSDGTTSYVAAGAKANSTVAKSGNTSTNVGVYIEVQKELDKK